MNGFYNSMLWNIKIYLSSSTIKESYTLKLSQLVKMNSGPPKVCICEPHTSSLNLVQTDTHIHIGIDNGGGQLPKFISSFNTYTSIVSR